MTARPRRLRLAAAFAALALAAIGTMALPAPAQEDSSSDPSPAQIPTTTPPVPGPGATTTTTVAGSPTSPVPGGGTPTSSAAQVSPPSVAAGQSVTVTGTSGFAPSQTLAVTFDSIAATPSTVLSNASGGFTVSITVPGSTATGSHRITVTGRNPQGGQHQSVGTVSVSLARTGAGSTVALAVAGIVLLAVGYRLVEYVRWTPAVSTASWRRRG